MPSVSEISERVLDKVRPPKGMGIDKIDPQVRKRVQRGQEALETKRLAQRKLNLEFSRNNHYVTIAKDGKELDHQSTVDRKFGGEKDNWRVRRSHDILAPILKGKTSAVTQRIPGYEVLETSNDPEDYSGARTAEKVLRGGYERWGVREAFRRAVWLALVTEEAFLMPYFDTSIGPFVRDPENPEASVGMGEICYAVYSGLEVVWEDGVQFKDSPWYAIIHARPIEPLEQDPDFIGGKLKADAVSSPNFDKTGSKGANSVMVTDYLERPCPKHPNGRRLIYASDREIFPADDYPLRDQKGNVVDEPCLRRIAYAIDGGSERARGLVTSLIEVVRDFDFSSNKAVEYLQLVMVPQFWGPEGALKSSEISDEPGVYHEFDKDAWEEGHKPELRQMPPMPSEFATERDRAQALLGYLANENLVPSQVESAKAINALGQKDSLAWQDFVEDVEACQAACARDSLVLAQRYFTDERLIQFRGRTGWEALEDFRGADIRGQTDVRIRPGSIEPLTRAVIEQRIMNIVGMFPGYFPPEVIIAALSSGDFDRLNESYEEDEAQVNFIINQIRAGTFWDLPPRPALPGEEEPKLDPLTRQPMLDESGQPVMLTQLPGWMPRIFDGVPIFKRRIEAFMKSDEWRYLDPMVQQATGLYYQALLQIEAKNAAKAAIAQNQTAMQLGAENAARPAQAKQTPSLPSPAGAEGAQAA